MSKNFHKKKIAGKIVACIDIGSSKLVCLIAALDNDEITVIGYSHKEARGIAGGTISDMRLAQKSITNAVSEAERMAGINIERIMIGLSGSQVISSRKEESIKIAGDMVKSSDVNNLANKVRGEFRKNNREMIHLIPIQYHIDDSLPVQNPRYMSGEKLFAKFHTVSTSQTTIRNIENCLRGCQLSVNNYVVEPYAAALSCLTENEMNLGSLLIDIGADVTSFCLIMEGKLVYVGNVAMGGSHITRDIATILNINFSAAEKIKTLNSSLIINQFEEKETIKYKMTENDELVTIKVTRGELCDIMKSRIEEILEGTKNTLEKSGVPGFLVNNIVITGGTAAIVGIDKLASEIFIRNARIGYPNEFEEIPSELFSSAHACSFGMLIFLKNLYLKEKIKDGFESRNGWLHKLMAKIVSV